MLRVCSSGLARYFAFTCKKTCCWNCHQQVEQTTCDFFCKNCHKLLPPAVDDYFSLFDQPRSFDIDTSRLEKTYKSYQRQVHPDKFFEASKTELRNADKVSCCVNEGYKTLSDPIKRAEYMIGLFKLPGVADVPKEFLMKCLMLHQKVSQTSDTKVLVQVMKDIQAMIKEEQANLSKCLKIKQDNVVADPKGAAEGVAKMKYLARVRDLVREKLPLDMT